MKVVCFDRDGVVAKRGTWWENGEIKVHEVKPEVREKIKKLSEKYFVCITSGRSLEFLEEEWRGFDVGVHGEIGNLVSWQGKRYEEEWNDEEVRIVEEIRSRWQGLRDEKIVGFEPKKKIVTMHCRERVVEAEEMVRDERLYCWWNGEAYDVGLKRINKLTGIKRWIEILGVPISEVMMVGHGINDQGAMGGVGGTISVDDDEEVGGERVMDRLLG